MRHLQGPAAPGLDAAQRHREPDLKKEGLPLQLDDVLNPPTGLVLGAAGVYLATFLGLRRASAQLRARPLVLQLAACAPAGA
ncbi:unnamed protein product, partial [Prorocentrum cordatum]